MEPSTPAPSVDPFVAIMEAARKSADADAPKVAAEPPVTEVKAEPPVETELQKWTKLQKENAALASKVGEFEAHKPEIQRVLEVKKLIAEGKPLEAFAAMTGQDPDAALLKLMEAYVEKPVDKPEDKEKKRLDAVEKELADAKKYRADVEQKAIVDQSRAFVGRVLDSAPEDLELCGRPENREEATGLALDGALELARARKLELASLDDKTTAALVLEAFGAVEKAYDELGKRNTRKPRETAPATSASASSPASARVTVKAASSGKATTFEDILAKARAMAEAN